MIFGSVNFSDIDGQRAFGPVAPIDPNDVPINIDRNPGHVCPSRDNPMIVFSLTVGATPGVGNVTAEELRPHDQDCDRC